MADKCFDRVNEALEPSAVFISSTIDGESRASRTHIGHGKLLPLLNPRPKQMLLPATAAIFSQKICC